MSRRTPRATSLRPEALAEPPPGPSGLLGDVQPAAAAMGETFRRVALGLAAALFVARAYWPAEYRTEADSGTALGWTLAMLVAAIIGLAGMWLEGGLRLRRGWTDLAVVALFGLVAWSATHAADRRIAINFAWEWVGVGMAYLLVRHLPRTRGESSALAAALVATAVALSAYGLYQVAVEFPEARAYFKTHQRESLIRAGLSPDIDDVQLRHFKDRLLGSREPVATFALANTLAGVLVGPAVIALCVGLRGTARRRDPSGDANPDDETPDSRAGVVLLALPPLMVMLVCLLLTKSRSAYLGLIVAMTLFAWRERRRFSARTIAIVGLILALTIGLLVAVAALAGQLDAKVLTESTKSLRYRLEYWRGAWGVIWDGPNRWWSGVGPGNFAGPYLKHKLPQASEEIADPHNLALDVWATAGLPALVALVAALAFGFRTIFGRPRLESLAKQPGEDAAPPRTSTWLLLSAGVGGSVLVVLLGRINLFGGDSLPRWSILLTSWWLAAALGRPLWNRGAFGSDVCGLAVVAIVVNLLAAGGIGFAPVALMLWGLLAIGQNLRDDRPEGVRRALGGREIAFFASAGFSAILGTFFGTVLPFWRAESAMASAEAALVGATADPQRADEFYRLAADADRYGSRARIARANLEFLEWRRRGKPADDFTWHRIDGLLKSARTPPRDPNSLLVQRLRARYAREFLDVHNLFPAERFRIRTDRRDACLKACRAYPTDPMLRIDCAEALADLELFPEAIEQAMIALALSYETPHRDRKLTPHVRDRLERQISAWRVAKPTPPPPTPKPATPKKGPITPRLPVSQ